MIFSKNLLKLSKTKEMKTTAGKYVEKQKPYQLLVGMQCIAIIMEISMEAPQKNENKTAI